MIVQSQGHTRENQISLLQCILETCVPPAHGLKAHCGTNDCPRCVYDTYKAELEAPEKSRPSTQRAFPMLDGVRKIPWLLAHSIWETLYEPLYHDQKLERLAERGGFGWEEVQLMARTAAEKGLIK